MLYNTHGDELSSAEEFIKCYEDMYFMKDDGLKNTIKVASCKKTVSINPTKESVEDIIGEILEKGIQEPIDVKHILAWKTGAIDMKKSDDDKIVYRFDWGDDKEDRVKDRVPRPQYTNHYFQLKKLADYICAHSSAIRDKDMTSADVKNIINYYCEQKKKDEKIKSVDEAEKSEFEQVGIVYMTTFLYFMTGGFVPIYDKYVHIALKAIHYDKQPGSPIFYSGPADNREKTFRGLMDEYLCLIKKVSEQNEIKLIRTQEDDAVEEIRRADRALWVYGHLFNLDQDKEQS